MSEPDFSLQGVDGSKTYTIKDGENVIKNIRQAAQSNVFNDFNFVVTDESGNDYFLQCLGYTILDRFGKQRLYFAVNNLEEEQNTWYVYYIAQRTDGEYLLVHETDDGMFEEFKQAMDELANAADSSADSNVDQNKKKSGKGWKIALGIILFPLWLLWEFIKALLSLLNIGFGDSTFVRSFKDGYNGNGSSMKEYTFTNDMGCEQTVYSKDGKNFYSADGSFVGSSSDGGKTIH